jgi:uncharacterized protein (TIGR03435 family)
MDETGYKGTFDVDVKLSSDEMWGRVPVDSDPSGLPTAAGAFRELGIKLELVKAPVEMLVIDSNRQAESELRIAVAARFPTVLARP